MSPFLLRAALAAMTLPALALAKETVSRSDVIEAIRVFDANACGNLAAPQPSTAANEAVAQASNTILHFALESDDVVVDLGTDAVTWCDVKKGLADLPHSGERGLLLAAYLAGSVSAQLKAGSANANPYAGWVHLIPVYRAMKARQGVEIPEIERLLALQASGGLARFAAVAEQKSVERLKKLYGGDGKAPAQPKSAPALASASSD
jgi:hypothetical protein